MSISREKKPNDYIDTPNGRQEVHIPNNKKFNGTTIERDLIQEIAIFMCEIGITDNPGLRFFKNDLGIFEGFYSSRMRDPSFSMVKEQYGSELYLMALGSHALGAGIYIALCQSKNHKPLEEFQEDELLEMAYKMHENDVYELALQEIGFAIDSNNKKCLDAVVRVGVTKYIESCGDTSLDAENIKILMKVLYNAGITVVLGVNY